MKTNLRNPKIYVWHRVFKYMTVYDDFDDFSISADYIYADSKDVFIEEGVQI